MEINEIRENTYSIIVPRGIRYLSLWQGFEILPFPHILDKQIPGCGFTEFCLTNNQNTVLCSPRKMLLENKYDQHKDDIYYLINSNEDLNYDMDLNKDDKSSSKHMKSNKPDADIQKEKLEYYIEKKNEIREYINKRKSEGKPYKIIVTYDSFYLVKKILNELPETISEVTTNRIQFIVDEFQSIFTDATFKSSTENDFITSLKGVSRVCFVSATPMIEEYLRQIDIFKDLPYYELDWSKDDPSRTKKPNLKVRITKSAISTAQDIAKTYLNGNFESKYVKDSEGNIIEIQSKEAVFYLNSVNSILSIIKKLSLEPEQVNILCARTEENKKKVKRMLGSRFSIGRVPLKGEEHKMFTFCTRTVYLGADFYSTNARSFILSDANLETLAVDISLDLPQILGRQRLIENPWKDEAEFYYKSICKGKIVSKEYWDERINAKMEETNDLLSVFNKGTDKEQISLVATFEDAIQLKHYKRNYVAVNKIMVSPGVFIKKPIVNDLVRIAERRAFDIQQVDYSNRFSVFSAISNINISSNYQEDVVEFFKEFEQLKNLSEKLKYFCEYQCSDELKTIIFNQITEKHFQEYLSVLTPEELRSTGYNITKINKKLGIITFNKETIVEEILRNFSIGDKISKSSIKNYLERLYFDFGYEKSPKASDLDEYFEIKDIKLKDDSGKWVNGFEIIKRKY